MRMLLENADLHTMSASMPRAEAAVLSGGRFVYVGTRAGAYACLGGRKHETLDAMGHTVLPGFHDTHMHFAHLAKRGMTVALEGARSVEDVVRLLRTGQAGKNGGWLVGEGWNQENFDVPRMPTCADLDAVSEDAPVVAVRACGHILCANSRALALSGAQSGDGLLREDAQAAIWAAMPAVTEGQVLSAMLAAQQDLHALGITAVGSDDLGSVAPGQEGTFLRALRNATQSGALRLRYAEQALMGSLNDLQAFFAQGLHLLQGDAFHVSHIKLLLDGSLGARTAWLRRPYTDDPRTAGISLHASEALHAIAALAADHGMPLALHAIGDAAMAQALDAIESISERDLRHAIVHAQIMDLAQALRCGALGTVVMAQPIFLRADAPIVRGRVGDALADTSYRWKTMLGAGAHVAFGTDCPVEPASPLPGLYAAVTRRGAPGMEPYLPGEAFALDEALYAYTAAGAYACGQEERMGKILPGMLADFTVLRSHLDAKEPASILEAGVRATFIGGECVYGG